LFNLSVWLSGKVSVLRPASLPIEPLPEFETVHRKGCTEEFEIGAITPVFVMLEVVPI